MLNYEQGATIFTSNTCRSTCIHVDLEMFNNDLTILMLKK
jgi:hypothetical protein